MHIVTFTRSTPDTAAKVEVGANGAVGWGDAATVVNPWDEYSLEETIRQGEAHTQRRGGRGFGDHIARRLEPATDETAATPRTAPVPDRHLLAVA